jgi:hypothetical protein
VSIFNSASIAAASTSMCLRSLCHVLMFPGFAAPCTHSKPGGSSTQACSLAEKCEQGGMCLRKKSMLVTGEFCAHVHCDAVAFHRAACCFGVDMFSHCCSHGVIAGFTGVQCNTLARRLVGESCVVFQGTKKVVRQSCCSSISSHTHLSHTHTHAHPPHSHQLQTYFTHVY